MFNGDVCLMSDYSKHLAVVKISDPTLVQARLGSDKYDKGAIYCSIPEIGMDGTNLVYCRYGLSIPYLQVKVGWKLWVEPTIENTRRWIYTGIADCGQDSAITPATTDGLLLAIQGLIQIKNATQNMKLLIDGMWDLLTSFDTTGSPVAHTTGPATLAKIITEKAKWALLLKE